MNSLDSMWLYHHAHLQGITVTYPSSRVFLLSAPFWRGGEIFHWKSCRWTHSALAYSLEVERPLIVKPVVTKTIFSGRTLLIIQNWGLFFEWSSTSRVCSSGPYFFSSFLSLWEGLFLSSWHNIGSMGPGVFSFRSEELNGDTCDSCAYIDLILLEMFQYSGWICSGKLPWIKGGCGTVIQQREACAPPLSFIYLYKILYLVLLS